MATHSRILAWEIPWTKESGGLQSIGVTESDMTEYTRMKNETRLVKDHEICDPMDSSLPGSTIHVIFQARKLE